jgi:hypothetical protein
MNHITIQTQGEDIGSIIFDQPERALSSRRIASGIRIYLPASVSLRQVSRVLCPVLLENLKVTLLAGDIEIGVGQCTTDIRSRADKQAVSFTLDLTLEALAVYESLRAGDEPQFTVLVSGEIRYALSTEGLLVAGQWPREACSIASAIGQHGFIKYSRDAWTKMLREAKVHETVLVEIPYPSDPPCSWELIWDGLQEARNAFDAGGSTGWNSCVGRVRFALEKWREIEAEEKGPAELHDRTKEQRIDNIRWMLMQYVHYAPHTKADKWTRDDALFALSTLSSLLAIRRP